MGQADKIFHPLNKGEEDRPATKTFGGSRADPNLRRLWAVLSQYALHCGVICTLNYTFYMHYAQ